MNNEMSKIISSDKPSTLLVCTDGSECSDKAVDWAAAHSKATDRVILYTACEPTAPAIDVLNATDVEVATHKSEEKQWLHDVKRKEECFKIVEESSKKLNNIKELAMVVDDTEDVKQGICKYAKEHDVDTIVVGSHGRGTIGRMLLGSVSSYVVSNSDKPVTVVR